MHVFLPKNFVVMAKSLICIALIFSAYMIGRSEEKPATSSGSPEDWPSWHRRLAKKPIIIPPQDSVTVSCEEFRVINSND